MSHTPGAIRAAEAITGHPYDRTGKDRKMFPTARGNKTIFGVTAIIDCCTAEETNRLRDINADLLAALEEFVNDIDQEAGESGDDPTSIHWLYDQARAAIAKAKAGKG